MGERRKQADNGEGQRCTEVKAEPHAAKDEITNNQGEQTGQRIPARSVPSYGQLQQVMRKAIFEK